MKAQSNGIYILYDSPTGPFFELDLLGVAVLLDAALDGVFDEDIEDRSVDISFATGAAAAAASVTVPIKAKSSDIV